MPAHYSSAAGLPKESLGTHGRLSILGGETRMSPKKRRVLLIGCLLAGIVVVLAVLAFLAYLYVMAAIPLVSGSPRPCALVAEETSHVA